MSDQLIAKTSTYTGQHKHRINVHIHVNIHASSRIRTYDPGIQASEDSPCLFFLCEAIGTAATPGLLCQPRVIVKMIVEKQMECRLAEETCPSPTSVHHKIPHDQTRV
jgi:hypothetical protein